MPSRASHLLWATAAMIPWSGCNPWGGPEPPAPPPRGVYEETTYEAGRIAQGTALQHVFALRNEGGRDLSIDNVRAGCGCAARASTRSVAPGAEGAIETRCDTDDAFGQQNRTVTVYSNDPVQPVTTLTLRADVDADVAADPPQLYVGHVQPGDTLPSEVRVVIGTASGVSVDQVHANGPVLDAVLGPPASGGIGKRVRLAIRPNAPPGHFQESITVHTTSKRRPVLTVSVAGIVDGESGRASSHPK